MPHFSIKKKSLKRVFFFERIIWKNDKAKCAYAKNHMNYRKRGRFEGKKKRRERIDAYVPSTKMMPKFCFLLDRSILEQIISGPGRVVPPGNLSRS